MNHKLWNIFSNFEQRKNTHKCKTDLWIIYESGIVFEGLILKIFRAEDTTLKTYKKLWLSMSYSSLDYAELMITHGLWIQRKLNLNKFFPYYSHGISKNIGGYKIEFSISDFTRKMAPVS